MKKFTLAVLVIVILGLTKFAFAQPARPDLKVKIGPVTFISTKYPPYYQGHGDTYRLVPGDVVDINVEVSNNGQAPSGPFTLEVVLDTITAARYRVFHKKYADLKPGEKDVFYPRVKIETPDGDIRCQAGIVAMGKDDWNPSDNSQSYGTILYWNRGLVAEYLRPDLEIKLTSPDDSRHLARTVRLLAVVTNRGNAASPATEIVLKCKEKDTKKHAVPPLKPGASFRHEFQHK